MSIHLCTQKIMNFLFIFAFLLIFAHIVSMIFRFQVGYWNLALFDYLNLDDERNISAFFSSIILLFSSILLFIINFLRWKENRPDYKYWLCLALVFLFLSIDENTSVHELVIRLYWRMFGKSDNDNYIWLIPYGIFFLVMTALYWKFVFSLPRKITVLIFVSAALYVTGAMGFEAISALYIGQSWFRLTDFSVYDGTYFIISTTEETLEIMGVLTFIYALLAYIELTWKGLYLYVGERPVTTEDH